MAAVTLLPHKGDVNSNSRTIKTNDYGLLNGDGVHMNQTGAFNYADCLINDFLADKKAG